MSATVDKDLGKIVTPEARWIYPHLFQPRQMIINGKPKGEPQYELEMLFDPSSIADMKARAAAVAKAKWPGRDFKDIKFPFKSGDALKTKQEGKGKKADHYEGQVVMKTTSQFRPQVVDRQGNEILDASRVYSGCYGYAEVNFVAFDGNGENIPDVVKAYVNFAMKSRDGERIGGRDAKAVFAGVIGKESQEDPTAGLDDEIPV